MNCEICRFVNEADNPIIETKHWITFLANEQAYLGRSFITLKRHAGDLNELKEEERTDLFDVITRLESAVRVAFEPALFNLTCLMNLAYQNDPPDPHIHWHFIPRYNHNVEFSDLVFTDPEFGNHYAREKERSMIVSGDVRKNIIAAIKKNLE